MSSSEQCRPQRARQRVAIVYHFFPHYRAGILRELLSSPAYDYLMVGDPHDARHIGLTPWVPPDPERFIATRSRYVAKRYLFQNHVVKLAQQPDLDTLIYLGDAQFVTTWMSALAARRARKRVLFWTFGWPRHETGAKARIRNRFLRIADTLLLYGNYGKQRGIENGFDPTCMHVIYNSLDDLAIHTGIGSVGPGAAEAERHRIFGAPNLPMVMCCTRLHGYRRVDLLIEALALLREQGLPTNLLVVGDGPAKASLEEAARRRRISARFIGSVYNEKVLVRWFTAARVTASPGDIGLAAIHSMAYGTPVVSHSDADSQMPEFEAIVPGVTGGLFERGSATDLARALREWIDRDPLTPAEHSRCKEPVKRFYNPQYQRHVIERALDGLPADDVHWIRNPSAPGAPRVGAVR